MGFLDKIKQIAGIGGVKLKIQLPATINRQEGKVEGTAILTSKSKQHVENLSFELEETYITGSRENQRTQYFTCGKLTLDEAFDINSDETKNIPFSFTFHISRSENQNLQDKGGFVGTLGKIGSALNNERSVFHVKASAKVTGAILGGSDVVKVELV
jgi:sporulation-control protein spo0M